MIAITVSCSNHQLRQPDRPIELIIDVIEQLDVQRLKRRIERHDWIVQFNGDHMDTYCSKKCAE